MSVLEKLQHNLSVGETLLNCHLNQIMKLASAQGRQKSNKRLGEGYQSLASSIAAKEAVAAKMTAPVANLN